VGKTLPPNRKYDREADGRGSPLPPEGERDWPRRVSAASGLTLGHATFGLVVLNNANIGSRKNVRRSQEEFGVLAAP
jgi:hypothetical protein